MVSYNLISRKQFLLCFISLLYSYNLASQAPGYMGKRLVAGYGFYFSPALLNPNGFNQSLFSVGGNSETGSLAFNSQHEAYLEYATKKRTMVGVSARFYRTAYGNGRQVVTSTRRGSPTGCYKITGISYSLYGKFFRRNYLAPWGRYFIFGPTITTYYASYDPNEMYVAYIDYSSSPSKQVVYSNFGPQRQFDLRLDFILGFGRSRIVNNRISLDYGFNANFLSALGTPFEAFDIDVNDRSYSTASSYIEETAPRRIRNLNRFNVYLKIGGLLF